MGGATGDSSGDGDSDGGGGLEKNGIPSSW